MAHRQTAKLARLSKNTVMFPHYHWWYPKLEFSTLNGSKSGFLTLDDDSVLDLIFRGIRRTPASTFSPCFFEEKQEAIGEGDISAALYFTVFKLLGTVTVSTVSQVISLLYHGKDQSARTLRSMLGQGWLQGNETAHLSRLWCRFPLRVLRSRC
jgi:hypothetical protein